MRILLLGGDQVLECFSFADPEPGEDVGCRIAVCVLQSVEVLEHVIHGAAQAVWHFAGAALVAVAEIEIPQHGIVQDALQNDILVAGRAGIVDAA